MLTNHQKRLIGTYGWPVGGCRFPSCPTDTQILTKEIAESLADKHTAVEWCGKGSAAAAICTYQGFSLTIRVLPGDDGAKPEWWLWLFDDAFNSPKPWDHIVTAILGAIGITAYNLTERNEFPRVSLNMLERTLSIYLDLDEIADMAQNLRSIMPHKAKKA